MQRKRGLDLKKKRGKKRQDTINNEIVDDKQRQKRETNSKRTS